MTEYPPFDALVAFQAAARHGSMTLAADELGVTQSAVSHRIRRLEAYMGLPLMIRMNAGLRLTPAGETLLNGLSDIFDGLSDLRTRCLTIASPDRLRVGVGAALADNWLVRRLPEFRKAFPDISIELRVVENEAPERVADLDLRILWMAPSEVRTTTTQKPLFREHVFPVCHPSLLPPDFIPGDPAILKTLPLLHKGQPGYQTGQEWSWSSWFRRLGLQGEPEAALRFTSLGPAVAAALQGAGVVLARSMLVSDSLAEGKLARVLPRKEDQLSSKYHVVRWPARLSGDPRVTGFVSWIIGKSGETMGLQHSPDTVPGE